MAANVQVVLSEDVTSLGKAGDVIKVRPGYARNFLVPRGLAFVATERNLEQIEHQREAARRRAAALRKDAEGIAAALGEVTVQVAKQAGEGGRLFGSVTAAELAKELHSKGYEVDRKKIELGSEGIRELGEHEVQAKLLPDVIATFKVEVVQQS